MRIASVRVIKQFTARFFSRLSLSFFMLCLVQVAAAQQAVPISPSVVLVLKLISSTHVKPATGIVISDNGLVLVSREFASTDGEIIVLDGGTDILSNGRPAKIAAQTLSGNLAILSVDGLERPGIALSDNVLTAGGGLHLEAFPPAEYIAKGGQPLSVAFDIIGGQPGASLAVSAETPLPYVSGAIIDDCGYLAGVSLTNGPQSLEVGRTPVTLFNDELRRVFNEMQITVPTARCVPAALQADIPAATTDNRSESAFSTQTQEQVQNTDDSGAVESESSKPVIGESIGIPSEAAELEPAGQVTINTTEPASVWRSIPIWLLLPGIIILGVLAWKALFLFRISKNPPEQKTTAGFTSDVQPASDEPVTAELETSTENSNVKPRSVPVFDLEIPESAARPAGCNGVVVIEGLLNAETGFKRFCFVDTKQVDIIIGRGDKDINIEHVAISRCHVRIQSDGEWLTLSDLGSRNGSFIGSVPCLPGEILYFKEDDEIFLGDVKLTIRMIKQEAEWA